MFTLGKISLSKRFVILELGNLNCKTCKSVNCLHCQVYEQCTCLITMETINAYLAKNMACYKVDGVHTILIENDSSEIHIYCLRENKWACLSCEKACKAKSIINCLPEHIFLHNTNDFHPKMESTSISTTHIPFTLPPTQSEIYNNQLLYGMLLPEDLYPEDLLKECPFGSQYMESNLKIENIGIIVYLENDVRKYKNHKGNILSF